MLQSNSKLCSYQQLIYCQRSLSSKTSRSGITKAVVWSSGEKMSLASSWHYASLLLSSQASEQEATSSGRPGGEHWTRCASQDKWLFPSLPGAGAALLSPAVPGTVFSQHLSAVSAFIFSDLAVQSPFWPFPAEAAQGGRGHHGDTAIHACSPGLLGDSGGPAAPPGLQGHERNRSVVGAQAVKHLSCSSTQAMSVFPQHFVSCSKKPHYFSTAM